MKAALVATAIATATTASAFYIDGQKVPYPNGLAIAEKQPEPYILTALPHTYANAPTDFDWCNHPADGVNYCTPVRNQHIPVYCGSCWAQSATSAFADRIKYQRKAKFPEVMLSPQALVWCSCNGCYGGDANVVHAYFKNKGIVEESCQAYVAQGSGKECTQEHVCVDCVPGAQSSCHAMFNYTTYYASEYGTVRGIDNIKAEIATRGPVVCYLNAEPIYDWGFTSAGRTPKAIFADGKGQDELNHAISVVGYGRDAAQNMDYWIVRNSWGSYWADEGFFRLKMGDNQLGMEANGCYWAVPKL